MQRIRCKARVHFNSSPVLFALLLSSPGVSVSTRLFIPLNNRRRFPSFGVEKSSGQEPLYCSLRAPPRWRREAHAAASIGSLARQTSVGESSCWESVKTELYLGTRSLSAWPRFPTGIPCLALTDHKMNRLFLPSHPTSWSMSLILFSLHL